METASTSDIQAENEVQHICRKLQIGPEDQQHIDAEDGYERLVTTLLEQSHDETSLR